MKKKNALIIHGGAPTSVINASLYGVIKEAKKHEEIENVYAAIGGTGGLLREEFLNLNKVTEEDIELLPSSPGSAIGTSRDPIGTIEYEHMLEILIKYNIGYVFFNGGNGTMDTCGKLYAEAVKVNSDIKMIGIPKTIDNDIAVTDHAPGFASAARYVVNTVSEVCYDVHALPIHVTIIETMGRNAGWLTAASALAGIDGRIGPDLIYLPERPFDEQKFLDDVYNLHKKQSGVVVVVSEGLKDENGEPIVEPVLKIGRAIYYGDISAYLANLVLKKLKIKARSEKPGLCGRASIAHQSVVDKEEAILVGKYAVQKAVEGATGAMVALEREKKTEYKVHPILVPIQEVMLCERVLPDEFINDNGNYVTGEFIEWCKPLLGDISRFVTFAQDWKKDKNDLSIYEKYPRTHTMKNA